MSGLAAVRRLVKLTTAAADLLRPAGPGVVVLIYHRVGGRTNCQIDLPTALFDEQMSALAATGRVTTIDQALDALAAPEPPSLDPVVVTFDDGTADFAEVAMPVMESYGIVSTLYLATRFVDEGMVFPDKGRALSWAALADAAQTGLVTFGSHTHNHALLDRLPPVQVPYELDRSKALIEEKLGTEARHFAYPKALMGSNMARLEVSRRFRSAALARTRSNPYGRTDPFRLWRSPIQVADGMRWFELKLEGGMALEDTVRRALNRRRYASAVT